MKFSVKRLSAIAAVFLVACAGWWWLGTVSLYRSDHFSRHLGDGVQKLWGRSIAQEAPRLRIKVPGSGETREILPSENIVDVRLDLEYRRKGLVWYSTFVCDFDGTYRVTNGEEVAQKILFHFPFPWADATYDRFSFSVDGEKLDIPVRKREGINELIEVAPGRSRDVRVTYRSRGLGEWRYRPAPIMGRVLGLVLNVETDFHDIDFPEGSLSPMKKERLEGGMRLQWTADDLLTNQDMGVVMPERLNPGSLSGRITYFAPVCLVFFFLIVTAISILLKINIHPMHYLFVAAGFFAFHLLFAYLVDHLNVHLSFILSALTSVGLVTGYLYGALKRAFPWKIAFAAQLFYLVLFSYSFFIEGVTGLIVTIGSVVTLAVMMKLTTGVDWDAVFLKVENKKVPA